MDIGTKIKNARIAAQLTQEQVAEALGVSRQTISNWENKKTYPDIVSVIKMSDLYAISLDHLLKEKEEIPMSNYIDYLEESTNTVKSRKKLSQTILLAAYLSIWAFALIVFWFFIGGSDAMRYSLVFLLPIVFGIMHMLAEYATFSVRNMIAIEFTRINVPHFELILIGAVLSAIGLGIGSLAYQS